MSEKIIFQRKPDFLSGTEIEKAKKRIALYDAAEYGFFILGSLGFAVVAFAVVAWFSALYFLSKVDEGVVQTILNPIEVLGISAIPMVPAVYLALKYREFGEKLETKLDQNSRLLQNWRNYQRQIAQNIRTNRAIRLESKPPYADPKQAVREAKEIFSSLSAPVGTTPHQKWDGLRRFCHARGIMNRSQSSIGLG